jgi:hypothetical protein
MSSGSILMRDSYYGNPRKQKSVGFSGWLSISGLMVLRRLAVPIEAIKEIRSGPDARYDREQFRVSSDCENRWLTIIYILDGNYKTLHMIAPTEEVFRMWDAVLRKLHAIRQVLMSGLGHLEMREKLWENQYWKGADQIAEKKLDFKEVESICRRLSNHSSVEALHILFKVTHPAIPFCGVLTHEMSRKLIPENVDIWTLMTFVNLSSC